MYISKGNVLLHAQEKIFLTSKPSELVWTPSCCFTETIERDGAIYCEDGVLLIC